MRLSYSSRRNVNIWPGFVDAFSALLIVIVFLLLIFTIGQFFLSIALTGKEQTISELDRVTAELSKLLATEKTTTAGLQERVDKLSSQLLNKSDDVTELQTDVELLTGLRSQLEQDVANLSGQLQESQETLKQEKELSADPSHKSN